MVFVLGMSGDLCRRPAEAGGGDEGLFGFAQVRLQRLAGQNLAVADIRPQDLIDLIAQGAGTFNRFQRGHHVHFSVSGTGLAIHVCGRRIVHGMEEYYYPPAIMDTVYIRRGRVKRR